MSSHSGPIAVHEAFSVAGQVVIVTGAAGLVGSCVAEVFAANGARVVASDREGPRLHETVDRIAREHSAQIVAQVADLTQPAELEALVEEAVRRFGALHTIVHVGAIPVSRPLYDEEISDFDRLFHTNLRSMLLLARYAIPHLEKTRGSMVNIASVNGHRALFQCSLYGATKAGMINMSRELAAEFGEKFIRFNTISPGLIRHEGGRMGRLQERLHPPYDEELEKRFGDEADSLQISSQPLRGQGLPYDVAMAALYLASPAARFVSGADLLVDGGKLHMFDHQHALRGEQWRAFWERVRAYLLELPDSAWKAEKPRWLTRG